MPSFWRQLLQPDIKTILLTGTGGGFDFVHGMLLYPTLIKASKRIILGSYSFRDPDLIQGGVQHTMRRSGQEGKPISVKKVDGSTCTPDPRCGHEVGLCRFLDQHLPEHRMPANLRYPF